MKKNRLVSALLCFCLVLALLPGQALAVTAITRITITMSDLNINSPMPCSTASTPCSTGP